MTTKNKVFDYIESMGGSMHYTEIVRYVYSLNHSPSEPYTQSNRGYYSGAFNIWSPRRTNTSQPIFTRYGHFVNPNCDRYLQKHESIRGLWVLINKSKTKNMKSKFKVGDKVIAKDDNGYHITTNGWTGIVTVVDGSRIDVRGLSEDKSRLTTFNDLREDDFKLDQSYYKFNIGDKVKLLADGGIYGIGEIGRITEIDTSNDSCRVDCGNGNYANWTMLAELELIESVYKDPKEKLSKQNKNKTMNKTKKPFDLVVDFAFAEEIYSASTPKVKQKIDDKYPGLFKQYKIGTFFELIGGKMNSRIYNTYILAQVEPSKVALISLDGNRFNDPIEVNKVMNITQTEFDLICGNDTKSQEDMDEYKNNHFKLIELNLELVNEIIEYSTEE